MTTTRQDVLVVLTKVYGESAMVQGLADEVVKMLEDHPDNLERELTTLIWNWMPGGDTAAYAAGLIFANYIFKYRTV